MNTQWIKALVRVAMAAVLAVLVAQFAQPWMGWLCFVAALLWQLFFSFALSGATGSLVQSANGGFGS